MELGHGPKELVFQMFYCTVYIQSFGKPSKPAQTQNNPWKLQLQGASDSKKYFDGENEDSRMRWKAWNSLSAYAGREMSKK